MTSDKTDEPGKDPPITEGQLVGLFKTARDRAGPSSALADVTAASAAVHATLNDVLTALATAGLDTHTRYQLTHVFDALKSAITETLSLRCSVPAAKPALAGTSAADPPQPDRMAVATSVLNAVQEALSHVEKAFDRRPPRLTLPPQRWYEHGLLLRAIQDLLAEALTKDAEDTWLAIDRLKSILRLDGIGVLYYDPEAAAEQADAFNIEDWAESPDGRYVTDTPAIVETSAEGTREILIRGTVLRLPAEDTE